MPTEQETKPKTAPDQDHAKRQDEALRGLFQKHGIEPPPMKTAEEMAKDGAQPEETKLEEQQLPEGTQLEKGKEKEGEKPAEGEKPKETAEAKKPEGGETPEYAAALQALRRARTPSKVIEGLTRDQLLAWGGSLAKDQANVDRMGTERAELLKRLGGTQGDNSKPDGAPEGAAPKETEPQKREGQPVDLKAAVKPLLEALALPDDEEGTLVSFAEAVTQPFKDQLSAQAQQFQVLNTALERLVLRDARRELGSRFPQLAEEATFTKVTTRMGELIKTGSYSDPLDLMSDAAKLVIGGEAKPEPDRARTTGQVTPNSRPTKVAVSREQEEDQILRELVGGAKPEDLRRKYGRF